MKAEARVRLLETQLATIAEADCGKGCPVWQALGSPAARTQEATLATCCEGLRERAPLTHVAVCDTEGHVWSLPRPFRQHHVLQVMHGHGAKQDETGGNHDRQGFLDAHGHYLTRKQAMVNASKHGQIKNGKIIGGILTSEDLW